MCNIDRIISQKIKDILLPIIKIITILNNSSLTLFRLFLHFLNQHSHPDNFNPLLIIYLLIYGKIPAPINNNASLFFHFNFFTSDPKHC